MKNRKGYYVPGGVDAEEVVTPGPVLSSITSGESRYQSYHDELRNKREAAYAAKKVAV